MRKIILVTVVLLLVAAGAAFAANPVVKHKAGSYNVTVSTDKSPLAVGDNPATITIKDASGMDVTDAKVDLSYFMPSMSSMKYTASVAVEKNGYTAVIKPTMPGEWKLIVKFSKPGEKEYKTTFLLQVQ